MWIFDTTLQPVTTAVLACPGVDAIRIWPLPVIQPWSENWFERPPGEMNELGRKLDSQPAHLTIFI
jgi:hypothetical protein